MKIVALSDNHGNLPDLPKCDVVCICGDIVPLKLQRNYFESISWLAGPFQDWALNLPCEKVIMIWGNHDFIGERLLDFGTSMITPSPDDREWVRRYKPEDQHDLLFKNDINNKISILLDSFVEFGNKKFYGTSWCPALKNWAFYDDSEGLMEKFNNIPADSDIILTHCPPKFGQQGIVLETNWNFGKNFGCKELQDIIVEKFKDKNNPVLVLSGHIHSGNHEVEKLNNIGYRNVSLLNEGYKIAYKPFEIEI